MDKKNEFREFVKGRPELIDYINSGEMTWQKFYEVYDIYGSDDNAWSKYNKRSNKEKESFSKIGDLMKGVNMDSIQEHIATAQKALGFVQELTSQGKSSPIKPKGPSTPRPINKFFED